MADITSLLDRMEEAAKNAPPRDDDTIEYDNADELVKKAEGK